MHYKVIILGATFLGAGLCTALGKDCLVIDSKMSAGYEFIKSLDFGTEYDKELVSPEAKELLDVFCEKGALADGKVCLLPCAFALHSVLERQNVMLNMKIVSVKQKDKCYEVTAYGVSGYRTYTADKVIDTRANSADCRSKTINVLVSDKEASFVNGSGYEIKGNWGYQTDAVIKCPVEKNADFIMARRGLETLAHNLSDGCKIVISADEFDYAFDDECIYEEDGILHMVSASFKNPILAFDAGVMYGKEGVGL